MMADTLQAGAAPGALAAHLGRLRAVRVTLGGAGRDGAAWREIAPVVREVLVMAALDVAETGNPQEFARRPWGSYTDDQCIKLGAIARTFSRELAGAGRLR